MCSMFVQQRLLICLDLQPRFLAQHRFETFVHGNGMHMQKVSDDYDSVRIMDVNITITVKSSRKEKWGHRAAFMGDTSSMWVQTADGVMAMQVRSHSVASITHGCCSSRCIRESIINTHTTPIPTLQLVLICASQGTAAQWCLKGMLATYVDGTAVKRSSKRKLPTRPASDVEI